MDLTCAELVELVTEYLEGTLAPADRRRFEDHIGECPHCAEYVEQIRVTIALSGRLREDALRPESRDALLLAFRGWADSPG
jgi:anti-sigma factor RsiW